MAIGIAKPVGIDIGVEAGLATMLVGVFAIFNGFGRPVFGVLTDKLTPRNTAIVSFVLIALASLLIWQIPSVPVYILAFAILWGCLGGWLAIAPTATASYFGTGDYPRCYGVLFLAYGAGGIAGPQLAGFIKTSTGSYMGVFPYVLVLAIIGLGIAFALLKPPQSPREKLIFIHAFFIHALTDRCAFAGPYGSRKQQERSPRTPYQAPDPPYQHRVQVFHGVCAVWQPQ